MDFNIQQKNQDAINGVIRAVREGSVLRPEKNPRMEYFRTLSFLPMMTQPDIPKGSLKERYIYTKIGDDFVKVPDFRFLAQEAKRKEVLADFHRQADFGFQQRLNAIAINDIKSGKGVPFFMGMFNALPEKNLTGMDIIRLALQKLKESNKTNNEAEHSEAMQILNQSLEKLKEIRNAKNENKHEKAKIKNLYPTRGERAEAKRRKHIENLYRKQNTPKITMEEYKKLLQESLKNGHPNTLLKIDKKTVDALLAIAGLGRFISKKNTGKISKKKIKKRDVNRSIHVVRENSQTTVSILGLFEQGAKAVRKAARTILSKAALL